MPKFEANINYVPPSPPSYMKQCNKSAIVKFRMELLLTTATRKQIAVVQYHRRAMNAVINPEKDIGHYLGVQTSDTICHVMQD